MTCHQARNLVEAYGDGQLELGPSLEIERHLSDCEGCASALENQRTLHSAIAGASLRFEAPARLRSRVRSAVRKEAGGSFMGLRSFWSWTAIAAPVATLAILAWVLVIIPGAPSAGDLMNQEIVSAHVRSLMGDHLMDFPSSDQHTVKPSFVGRLDFSPEVKDLSGDGFALLGGRLDYLARTPAAALVYQRRKHIINLFIRPAEDGSEAAATQTSLRGYNLIHWTRAGMRYAAVSDLNLTELREFQQALQK